MKHHIARTIRKFHSDRKGSVTLFAAGIAGVLIGVGGLGVDQARVFRAEKALQASTDMAALAAAGDLGVSAAAAVATAASYGAMNPVAVQKPSAVGGYPKAVCLASTGLSCGSVGANAVVVKQQVTVPLMFGAIFGYPTKTITATATASAQGGSGKMMDVMLVLDTTQSMTNSDPSCSVSSATKLKCAEAGIRQVLTAANPSLVNVGLIVFPPVATTADAAKDYACSTAAPTIANYNAASPVYTILNPTNDYKSSATDTALNQSSNLVKAVGGVSGCVGLKAVGGKGTYYADAVTAAQAALQANGRSGAQKVIVVLSDGDANASTSYVGSAKHANQCHQAISAAQAATAAGTWVYTAAYAAQNSGGCSTDTQYISPCATLQQMASAPDKFFPDTSSSSVSCTSSINSSSDIVGVFGAIGASISVTTPRLILDSTT
jgi:Flp pilus assembly protein TadG